MSSTQPLILALLGFGQGLFASTDLAPTQPESLKRYAFSSPGMGTTFNIVLYAKSENSPEVEAAVTAAFERVTRLNSIFSDYEPNSEINQATASLQPWSASSELFSLSQRSLELAATTRGAFDPTLGQLSRLWRSTRQRNKIPPAERLQKALNSTGWTHLKLNPETRQLSFTRSDLLLDFGGIAKGYAADEMLALLKSKGFSVALVQAGGDTAAGDPPPDSPGWPVTLHTGLDDTTSPQLSLANRSVSTSGDLHQSIEIEGVHYSHIINHKTGLGLTQRIACSVIASDTTTSDALATALCVLGPLEGQAIAKELHLTVRWFWIDSTGTKKQLWFRP